MGNNTNTSPIFSFGRYQGQGIWDIVHEDIMYIQWLYHQTWFKKKYPNEYHYLKENWDFWYDIYAESRPMQHPCDYE